MRIVDIRERPIRISRYRDPHIPPGGLTTSLVAVVTDVTRAGRPVAGYGFASIGRYAQSGLIRERFAPRLLRAAAPDVVTDDGANLDRYAGLRRGRDVLGFDPVHCYGLPGYLHIIDTLTAAGWPRQALLAARRAPVQPPSRRGPRPWRRRDQPAGLPSVPWPAARAAGHRRPHALPDVPGIGFELHDEAWRAFRSLGLGTSLGR
jgi:hypothetical protein